MSDTQSSADNPRGTLDAAIEFLKRETATHKFRDILKSATGHEILPLDEQARRTAEAISKWTTEHLEELSEHVRMNYKGRSNELGNFVEDWVRDKLNQESDFRCERPRTNDGVAQSSGYPDALLTHSTNNSQQVYFDVKIFQEKTENSTLRTFYYQPTNQSKVQHDAPHLLLAFQVVSLIDNNQSPFTVVAVKLKDIYDLEVSFKAEFNASNRVVFGLANALLGSNG